MDRTKVLLLVAGCAAVTAVAYWQSSYDAQAPAPRAPMQLAPVTVPGPRNTAAAPAPRNEVAPVAPSTSEAAAVAPAKASAKPAATKTPSRVIRRDAPVTATAERSESNAPASREVKVAPARATTYEQRVSSAAAVEDADRALAELQRLATDEPSRPEAYEAMAGISLRKKAFAEARERIDSALAHGGKATFAIIHDHSRGNFDKDDPKATCVGELTISAEEVKFAAPGEGDRFAANWADVREAGSNKFFGSGKGGFHVTMTAGGKYKNFNLAPESKDKAEGKLILDLMNDFARRTDRTK